MRYIDLFQKELISLSFAIVTAFILWVFRSRAKIVWGRTHGFAFMLHPTPPVAPQGALPQQAPAPFVAHTASFFVANIGRSAATNLEITFNWQPQNHQVWPVRVYDTIVDADGRFTLRFVNMAPQERFQIELLTPNNLPDLLNVRCNECIGTQIPMQPTRVLPKWAIGIFWILITLGVAAIFYIMLRIVTG